MDRRQSSLTIKNQFADPTKLFKESRYDGDDSGFVVDDLQMMVHSFSCISATAMTSSFTFLKRLPDQ